MATSAQIASMEIHKAVALNGPDELASPAFQIPLGFGLVGFQNVEWEREVLVVDGQTFEKPKFVHDLMRAVGLRKYGHRVLVNPSPLDVESSSLTSDQFAATLQITVSYQVINPPKMVSEQQPVKGLRDAIQGILRELIASHLIHAILLDKGGLQAVVLEKLNQSPYINERFKVLSVLRVSAQGDERLMEIVRQIEAAKVARKLIDEEGQNAEKKAEYELKIDWQRAELADELANRASMRRMYEESIILESQLQQKLIETGASIVISGMGDKDSLRELRDMAKVRPPSIPRISGRPVVFLPTPIALEDHSSILEAEIEGLDILKNNGEISNYALQLDDNNRIKASITKSNVEIEVKCPSGYPITAPEIAIRFPSGEAWTPDSSSYWESGIYQSLSQAIFIISKHIDHRDK